MEIDPDNIKGNQIKSNQIKSKKKETENGDRHDKESCTAWQANGASNTRKIARNQARSSG
jgi:hypothetical protein